MDIIYVYVKIFLLFIILKINRMINFVFCAHFPALCDLFCAESLLYASASVKNRNLAYLL